MWSKYKFARAVHLIKLLFLYSFFAQVANIVKVGTLLGLANVFKLFKKIIFNVPCLNTFHWVQVNGQQIMT